MMVSWVLRYIACKLCHFDLMVEVSFEAREQNLSLWGFEPIDSWRDGAYVIRIWKMDEFFVDEVLDRYSFDVIVQTVLRVVLPEPSFSEICVFLIESKLQSSLIFFSRVHKFDLVVVEIAEVLFGFFSSRSSQAFIVFYRPSRGSYLIFPSVEISLRVEVQRLTALSAFYDGCDELFQKTV